MRRLSIAAIFAVLSLSGAHAQTDQRAEALDAMEACRAIAADAVRLVCLDAAASLLDSLPAETSPAPATDTPANTAPVPAPPTPAPTAPQVSVDLEAERAAIAAERAALEAERAELERSRTVLAETNEAQQAETRRRGPLASAFFIRSDSREIPVSIERITRDRFGVHRFYTGDNEFVVQADTTARFRPPSALPASAIIRRSRVGSKWIVFDEYPKRSLKVSIPPTRN